jgi:phenylpropionate dioxygenase-like ring-hydroxylating dioxygenase large terminal subunit
MGSFFGEIENLSGQMGELVDISEWNLECNWKILVENTLEAYHVDFVHPLSFSKLKAKFGDFRFDSLANSFLGRTDMENPGVGRFVAGFQTRPHKVEGYLHLSLFPNFLMSTSYGIVFSVQRIVPLSARTTHMTSYLFHRAVDAGSRVTGGMLELMHESAVAFNRQVLTEDRQICEAVQRGVLQMGEATGLLSEEELRIVAFHETYASFMPPARLQDSGTEA